jgi:hypothetical protein
MTINIDGLPVESEQEAMTLMFHHLALAAQYFEATPLELVFPETFSAPAMKAWADGMNALYPA